jgi:hypothetical protein|nr:MAG TPA: hypothetical protein [Bacteriophage sp.]DAV23444.1 MAG TPA: hypothetical protein [Bacteriophage sp.]DAZ72168.1 MAG TPA: hypothetical protein [Caudoviricetes sp.]
MYQYTNKNGETFGITHTESSTMAYINGSYVAQAETDRELEEVLDHFSHTDIKKTLDYTGITREEKTAD